MKQNSAREKNNIGIPIPKSYSLANIIITNDTIWALYPEGYVDLYKIKNDSLELLKLSYFKKVRLLSKDRKENIVIVDEKNRIKRWNNKQKSWKTIIESKYNISGIAFDKNNSCFAVISQKGIFDIDANKIYGSNCINDRLFLNDSIWQDRFCISYQRDILIDKKNNLWIGVDQGEFGGELWVFNLDKKKFDFPKIMISSDSKEYDFWYLIKPPKSIIEIDNQVFIITGFHYRRNISSGYIYRVKEWKAAIAMSSFSEVLKKDSIEKTLRYPDFIGAGAYNPKDTSLYIYSKFGIYKANPNKDLNKKETWKPVLLTNQKLSHNASILTQNMEIIKMEFLDNGDLIFATKYDGIGIFTGKSLQIIK